MFLNAVRIGDFVYGTTGDFGPAFLTALDVKTGKAAWTFATRARVDSSPVIAGGRVYVGSSDGKLYVLDADSGKKLSEFDAGAGLTTSPAVASGRVVIGSQDGMLFVLG